jgi:hypothetical protein
MPIAIRGEDSDFYTSHLRGKVLECPYCTTLIVFGPAVEIHLHCHTCGTHYSISTEGIRYRLGAGLSPLTVPDDRAWPTEIPYPGQPDQDMRYLYPLDLFLQYVHEWETFGEEIERGRADLQQRITATVSAPLSDWQAFTDCFSLFTLRLPPGWTIEGGWDDNPLNQNTRSNAFHEVFSFSLSRSLGSGRPIQEGSSRAICSLHIEALPMTTEEYLRHVHDARPGWGTASSFHGYPAWKDHRGRGFEIHCATPRGIVNILCTPRMRVLEGDLKRLVDMILDSIELVNPESSQ